MHETRILRSKEKTKQSGSQVNPGRSFFCAQDEKFGLGAQIEAREQPVNTAAISSLNDSAFR
jgi:hypothetical protein